MTLELNDPSPSRAVRSAKTVPSVVDPFADGGEMGAVMRSVDWSRTPIGAVETWSDSLRMMVRFLLANRFPLLLWWGPEYVQLYNEAYRPFLGSKHPHSIGQPAHECWPEIWHVIGPQIDAPYKGGPSTWMEDIELEVDRHGYTEESHFTIAYSPVPDVTAPRGIGGVLAMVHEITQKVVAERRVALLRDLGVRSVTGAQTAEGVCVVAADILSRHSRDVPFALLYLLDERAERAHLAGSAGIGPDTSLSPRVIDLSETNSDDPMSAVQRAIANGSMEVVEDLAARFGPLPPGPWTVPPGTALVLPIPSTVARHPAGVVVAGVSALLALDDQHRAFLELLTTQIASVIAHARAYEEEKRRAEALAELERAKTAFFSNVSHEFTAAEARYRALVDASAQIVWVRGPDASIASEQPAWSSYTGQSFDEYAGWEWMEAAHPDDRSRLRTAWHRAIATRAPCHIEYRLRRHDGEFEWFEMRALPVFDAHGDVREYVGAETNITERRNAEEVRQQFVTLVENSADLVAIAELDGSLLFLNAAGRQLVGLTDASPVSAMQMADFSAGASKDTLLEVAMPAALREGVWRGEIDLRHVGTAAPIAVDQVIFPIFDPESGAPIRFATVARDIRERKRNDTERESLLQRERLARAEAEEARTAAQAANRSKSAFLAAMSHELRTPLNAIAGHAQLMELGVHGELTEAQREALARIQRSEQHLLALINDVLNFAKLEAGRVEYTIEDVSLTDSVAEVLTMVEPQLGAKGIGVDVDVARDLVVRADRDKVEQVLLNLLSNAVKFTGTGGRVRIDAPRRTPSAAGADGDGTGHGALEGVIFLRVSDTGVGVPREKQSEIFEPFIQLQRNLKRPTEGTGLGLAISRDLAHGMGGDLRVRSTVGRGSRFTLTLRRASESSVRVMPAHDRDDAQPRTS